jgi:hypothetical protein
LEVWILKNLEVDIILNVALLFGARRGSLDGLGNPRAESEKAAAGLPHFTLFPE